MAAWRFPLPSNVCNVVLHTADVRIANQSTCSTPGLALHKEGNIHLNWHAGHVKEELGVLARCTSTLWIKPALCWSLVAFGIRCICVEAACVSPSSPFSNDGRRSFTGLNPSFIASSVNEYANRLMLASKKTRNVVMASLKYFHIAFRAGCLTLKCSLCFADS